MDLNLKNRLVLVTGSSMGIGRAIAEAFLAEGARVVLNARNADRLEALKAELAAPERTFAVAGDVSDGASANRVADAVEAIGELDILVNNAGKFAVRPFEETSDDEWLDFYNVNVVSNVRLIRRFLPAMLERNYGRIINIASECGVRGLAIMAHYAATKSAQLGLTRSIAELTKGTGVTANSVLPGPTWTEGVEKYIGEVAEHRNVSPEQAAKDYFTENEPTSLIQRFVDSREVAQAVLMTAANAAINGASVRVEGGIIRSL